MGEKEPIARSVAHAALSAGRLLDRAARQPCPLTSESSVHTESLFHTPVGGPKAMGSLGMRVVHVSTELRAGRLRVGGG